MPPEYAIDGIFSVKSDVYSFGVLVLEIVSGKRNRGFYHPDHNLNLLGHVSDVNKYKLLFSFEFCPFFLVPFTGFNGQSLSPNPFGRKFLQTTT
jgi:hypothetical protein